MSKMQHVKQVKHLEQLTSSCPCVIQCYVIPEFVNKLFSNIVTTTEVIPWQKHTSIESDCELLYVWIMDADKL